MKTADEQDRLVEKEKRYFSDVTLLRLYKKKLNREKRKQVAKERNVLRL